MLKDHEDAFGHAMYDYLHGENIRPVFQVIERDDGFVGWDNVAGYFGEYAKWPQHQKRAMRYARGRVLDVGGGAGRASLYLQSKGLDVVDMDNSPLSVEVCRQRGLRNAVATPISQISSKLGVFDTVIMLGNNFGLFGSPEGARRSLKKLARMTSDIGRIIAESNDVYDTQDAQHLAYHELNRKRGRMSGQIRMRVRYRRYAGPWFDYLMVSKQEMAGILDGTDWKVRKYIDSERSVYIAIIEKKGS